MQRPNRLARDPSQISSLASPVFVLGAAYSGKSELAQKILQPDSRTLVIGTADLTEGLIAARVQDLKRQRPAHWQQVDGQLELAEQLHQQASGFDQVLVDSMNQWIANLVLTHAQKYSLEQLTALCEKNAAELCSAIEAIKSACRIVLVSSEVGAGITPPKPVARLFRQLVSRLNCCLADRAASVLLVTAGLPLLIKGEWPEPSLL